MTSQEGQQPVVGYVPGGWDMFHRGHLNILLRASELCDYLVVGVVTDDALEQMKGRQPMVPFMERVAVVGAVQFVNEVVADASSDKTEVWKLRNFDVLFKGDDWQGTPKGDRLEESMRQIGVKVVYLPYTQGVSSTALRGATAVPKKKSKS